MPKVSVINFLVRDYFILIDLTSFVALEAHLKHKFSSVLNFTSVCFDADDDFLIF